MKEFAKHIIEGLDRNKAGRIMFGAGMIGFMVSGCCLDSKAWSIALIGLLLSVGICYLGYQMTDLTESFKWESRKTIERKQANRALTYERWIRSTDVTLK